MIVRVIGGFQQPVKGYGKLASCAECTALTWAQGHSDIYEVVVWNQRVMLCKGHLEALGAMITATTQPSRATVTTIPKADPSTLAACPKCGETREHQHRARPGTSDVVPIFPGDPGWVE